MINRVIKALSTKSCPLDPMPIQLLKDHLDLTVHVVVVTDIVDGCVSNLSQTFPYTSPLKKQDPDRDALKNYRPIANIPFLSKVIEKAVVV